MQSLQTFDNRAINAVLKHASYFVSNCMADNTKIAYGLGWKIFTEWCESKQANPFYDGSKEALIALFLSDLAMKGEYKISSLIVYFCGVKWMYEQSGCPIDTKKDVLSKVIMGIKRRLGSRPDRKTPILIETLRSMTDTINCKSNIGTRDRALLVVGFAGAFRRSELVALNVEDFAEDENGYLVLVRKSKTDQEQNGLVKALPYGSNLNTCPVRTLKEWLKISGITSGPVFTRIRKGGLITRDRLDAKNVSVIVKKNNAIIDEMAFSGHSLRSGFVTTAAKNDVPIHMIMQQTGHKSVDSLMVYIRDAQKLKNCAASRVGL